MSSSSKISILTDGVETPAAPNGSVRSSKEWNGFVVEKHLLSPGELPEHTILDHRLTILTSENSVPFEYKADGRWKKVHLHPGSFSMQNHGDLGAPRWFKDFEFLAIAIKPEFYKKITAEEITPNQIELITQRGRLDKHIQLFAKNFLLELFNNESNGQLFGETLSMSFAMYLLNQYGSGSKKITEPKGKLYGLQVKSLIDFVSSQLHTEMRIDQLSEQVHLSPYHFAKIFKNTTGLSPHQFVLKMRIEKALEMMKTNSFQLTEIAHTIGFYDQSHFTHSFKRLIGITPKKYLQSL